MRAAILDDKYLLHAGNRRSLLDQREYFRQLASQSHQRTRPPRSSPSGSEVSCTLQTTLVPLPQPEQKKRSVEHISRRRNPPTLSSVDRGCPVRERGNPTRASILGCLLPALPKFPVHGEGDRS